MFEHMAAPERIQAAKVKTERVVDHLLYLLALHENNAIIVYSNTLSSQITYSHAANAFDVFRAGLHQFEIVRLCALWDRAEETKENIPTIAELIDHPDVINALAEETRSHWVNNTGTILNPSNDLQLRKAEEEELKRIDARFGQEQAVKARAELARAISQTQKMLASQRLTSIMNLRDKHLAHSLSETRRERKTGPVPPMEYGDEREVLSCSLAIVEAFYCWVNGKGFSFADSKEIGRHNAEALWKRCTLNIRR
jgi:HEPN superfamily AbiU2-like protein